MSRQVPAGTLVPNLDLRGACGGRLTLTSGTPVTTADVTGAGTVYFTPYGDVAGLISLYDGSEWKPVRFTEVSLALTLTSGKNYDIFGFLSAGNVALELSAAWTDDTTRADALATQNGIQVKSGAPTRRYLGTLRATGANVTEDSAVKRFLWNMYNRRPRHMVRQETTDSWTYATNSWRQANASTSNQFAYVCGLAEDPVNLRIKIQCSDVSGISTNDPIGVGVDSTTVNSATQFAGWTYPGGVPHCEYIGVPGIGYHFLAWLERCASGSTAQYFGDNGDAYRQGAMVGVVYA